MYYTIGLNSACVHSCGGSNTDGSAMPKCTSKYLQKNT